MAYNCRNALFKQTRSRTEFLSFFFNAYKHVIYYINFSHIFSNHIFYIFHFFSQYFNINTNLLYNIYLVRIYIKQSVYIDQYTSYQCWIFFFISFRSAISNIILIFRMSTILTYIGIFLPLISGLWRRPLFGAYFDFVFGP